MEKKLSDLLAVWFFDNGDRKPVDEVKGRISMLKSLELEIPILKKEVEQRIQRARRAGKLAGWLSRKQGYLENVKIQLINAPEKEPDPTLI